MFSSKLVVAVSSSRLLNGIAEIDLRYDAILIDTTTIAMMILILLAVGIAARVQVR